MFTYNTEIELILVDLFAGAGGVTTGVENATIDGKKVCKVIIAINHDQLAIESHKANHPDTIHFVEDVRTIQMQKLSAILNQAKKAYPNAKLGLWASLECTNFSKAKGDKPRDADSRTLAYSLYKLFNPETREYFKGESYIQTINPDVIFIENVREFMSWGPLDAKGRPVSMKEGREYINWVNDVKGFGYDFTFRIINSANLGAYTSRERYFAQFTREGIEASWPEYTHAKKASSNVFNTFRKWKAVKEVLDLQDEGNSIFGRKKPLSPKTLERIYEGLVKFVANGNDAFISKYFSGKPEHKNISLDGPAATVKTIDGQALVKTVFLQKYNCTSANGSVKHSVVGIDLPSPTITTQGRLSIIQAFLMQYHGNGINVDIEGPATTITTKDCLAFIKPQFIDKQYSGKHNNQSLDAPAGTLLSVPKMSLVTADPFLCPTLVAPRRHNYLVNPQYKSKGRSIDNPCFTLIARMDKMPPYLVTTQEGHQAIIIFENDCPITRRIKLFMAAYGIADIKMRMLNVTELLRIMGFPESYILKGSQTHQKKFIGNAVETTTAQKLIEAFVKVNSEKVLTTIAS